MTAHLFVSHISEEGDVARLIKAMIEEDFDRPDSVFMSSVVDGIRAGEDWLNAVSEAIKCADTMIVLCSSASIERAWVQFEIGAAWMKGMTIIPVCHSGLRVNDLPMPLSRLEGVELGTPGGLETLYDAAARALERPALPPPPVRAERLVQIEKLERKFRRAQVKQFERYIDVLIPSPGVLGEGPIPGDAVIQSDDASLQLFGFFSAADWTWRDIVRAAERTPDRRWVEQLQHSIRMASNNEWPRAVQAVYHAERGAFQPQLARKEVRPDGSTCFHVHFVETVVAPLFEVPNEFGLIATMLRLGLRFRYEVIERFQSLARGRRGRAVVDDVLARLRGAIEVIETDAHSRGAADLEPDRITALFKRDDEQDEMIRIQDDWQRARSRLFCDDPPPTWQDLGDIARRMRSLNFRFMKLGTQRFHQMVSARWNDDAESDA